MLCEKAGQDELLEIAAVPGTPVGKAFRLFGSGGRRAVFLGSTAVYLYDQGDKEAEVACIATLFARRAGQRRRDRKRVWGAPQHGGARRQAF